MPPKKINSKCIIKQICCDNIEYCIMAIGIFQEYLDDYGDNPDGYTKLVTMVIDAYNFNIDSLFRILGEIDPKIKKKLLEIYHQSKS